MAVLEVFLEGGEYSVNGWIEDGELVAYAVTERLTVPGKKPLGVMIAEVYRVAAAADEARVVAEAPARRRARSASVAAPATRRSCSVRVAASSSRPRRAWAAASTPTSPAS